MERLFAGICIHRLEWDWPLYVSAVPIRCTTLDSPLAALPWPSKCEGFIVRKATSIVETWLSDCLFVI